MPHGARRSRRPRPRRRPTRSRGPGVRPSAPPCACAAPFSGGPGSSGPAAAGAPSRAAGGAPAPAPAVGPGRRPRELELVSTLNMIPRLRKQGKRRRDGTMRRRWALAANPLRSLRSSGHACGTWRVNGVGQPNGLTGKPAPLSSLNCRLALHTCNAHTRRRHQYTTTMATTTAKMVVSMLLVQLIGVGVSLLSKIALDGGMSPFVMITYRNLIAAVVVCPFCFVFEREMWKVLNWTVWAWIFANAAFGDVLAMGLYFYGLRSTSAAFSSIFQNLIPVATFIIAMVLRTENLSLRKLPGKMKLLGALLCVGGTMMVSLLRGPELHMWRTNLLRHAHDQAPANTAGAHHDMVVGTLWLCGSCVSYALYFIVQEGLVKVYPSTYWMAMLTSLVGSMQSFIVGVFLVHERSEWMLKWDLKLLTVVYSGVLNTGLAFLLISWVISRSGPIYPAMFNSVSLVVTTVLDSVLLGTSIYIGSVLGIVLVVMGMYAFLWGKGTEVKLAAIASAAAQEQEA